MKWIAWTRKLGVKHWSYRDGGAHELDWSGCTGSVHWQDAPRISRSSRLRTFPRAWRCAVDEAHDSLMSSSRVLDEDRFTSHQAVTASDSYLRVDLVNAQTAEAWQVQQKRWKPQLRQEGTWDGQSFEVLRTQNIVAHHEWERVGSVVLAWSESVHGFDIGRVWEYVPWIQTPERQQVGYHIGTIPLRWWHSGSSKWLGLVWEQCRGDNTCEEPGPVAAPVGLSVWLTHWKESSQWVIHGHRRCLSSRSLIATHGVQEDKVDRRDSSACSAVATWPPWRMEGQCCHEGADGWTCHLVTARHWQHRSRRGVRCTSLTTTINDDNHNHRTSKHASTSWRSDGSPSCLGGSSHGWVRVKTTHSTPVPTSVERLWVAH